MSGWAGVTLGPPAAAVVAAALRVGHHHVVLGLAADQTLVHMEETHVLVSRGAIWENKGEDKGLWLNSTFISDTSEHSESFNSGGFIVIRVKTCTAKICNRMFSSGCKKKGKRNRLTQPVWRLGGSWSQFMQGRMLKCTELANSKGKPANIQSTCVHQYKYSWTFMYLYVQTIAEITMSM